LASLGAILHAQQRPTFRASTDTVRVTVGVERNGRPIADLTTRQFHVTVDGEVQQIEVTAAPAALSTVLMVDVSGSVTEEQKRQLAFAGGAFVDALHPDDTLSLLTFNRLVHLRTDRLEDARDD